MKYWARTVPPLKQEKGYFETTYELMEWMDSIIYRSPIHVKKLEEHFVVLKVDTDKNPELLKVFGENKEERKTPTRKKLVHLRKYLPKQKEKPE